MFAMTPKEEVKLYSENIFEMIFNQQDSFNHSIDIKIIHAGKKLHDIIKCDINFQSCLEQLRTTLANQPSYRQERSLMECHNQLLSKLAAKPTWRSYGNVLVSVGLMEKLALELNLGNSQPLQNSLKTTYTNCVVEHFTDFISSMGGFSDLTHYINYVTHDYGHTVVERLVINILTSVIWSLSQLQTFFSD